MRVQMEDNKLKVAHPMRDIRETGIKCGDVVMVSGETIEMVPAEIIGLYKHHVLVQYKAKLGYVKKSLSYGSLLTMGAID